MKVETNAGWQWSNVERSKSDGLVAVRYFDDRDDWSDVPRIDLLNNLLRDVDGITEDGYLLSKSKTTYGPPFALRHTDPLIHALAVAQAQEKP